MKVSPCETTTLTRYFVIQLLVVFCLSLTVFNSYAFSSVAHKHITKTALKNLGFDDDSIAQVWAANRFMDSEFMNWAPAHFDSESFSQGSAALRERFEKIMISIAQCDRKTALSEIGHSLHAVQDFYSHSNFVEMREQHPMPYPDLFQLEDPGPEVLCQDRETTTGLTSGYWPDDQTPLGKCSHKDLNKDSFLQNVPFGKPWHDIAMAAASEETKNYLLRVFEELQRRYPNSQANLLIDALKKTPEQPCIPAYILN